MSKIPNSLELRRMHFLATKIKFYDMFLQDYWGETVTPVLDIILIKQVLMRKKMLFEKLFRFMKRFKFVPIYAVMAIIDSRHFSCEIP